jgi:transposase InsO family protein
VSRDLAEDKKKAAQNFMEVTLDQTIVMEDCGEYMVRCKVTDALKLKQQTNVLFISDRDKLSRRNILAADALYNTSNISKDSIMVRVINPVMCKNIIYKGTKLGRLIEFKEDVVMMFDNDKNKSNEDVVEEILKAHRVCLSKEEYISLRIILNEYKDIFSRSSTDVGLIKGFKHKIETNNHKPICLNPRKVPIHVQNKVDTLVDDLENKGIVKKTVSSWNSPIVVVPKKNGDIRLCIDYRHLNSITERPIYHIPDAKELFDSLHGSEYFSALDLSMGYHQIEMDERDMCKTAFTTRNGQYSFMRMPFGLCGAPQSFQRVMAAILRQQNWKNCLIYLDDICIFGKSLKEHNERLRSVLSCLAKAGVKLSPGKCVFMRKEVTYLGHVIDKHGIRTDPSKISKIKEWPIPKTAKELKTFISLCGYYRKFVSNFAEVVRPLELLCNEKAKNKSLNWEDRHTNSWSKLKELLCKAPILSFPQSHGEYILDTDASQKSVGAVLSQIQNGQEKVISYASHALSKHEMQYCVTRRELLAVYKYVKYFQHYLLGKKFIIRTDHRALIWMLNWRKPNTSQYCSWKAELELYDFDIIHRKGEEHINADSMSRYPHEITPCKQCDLLHANPKRKTNIKTIAQVDLHESTAGNPELDIDEPVKAILVSLKKGLDIKKIMKQCPSDIKKEISLLMKHKNDLIVLDNETLAVKKMNTYVEVPIRSKREKLIREIHSQLGHPGIFKMIKAIRERYFWPLMDIDVSHIVNSCKLCQQYKHQKSPKRPMGHLRTRFPFEKIAMDVTGPFKITKAHNRYILGIVDHFSKYTVLVPLRSIDSESIIEALFSRWISIFGTPNSIHSDRGSNLNSRQILRICEAFKIKKTKSTPYFPQGDGVIERMFRTIKPMLGIVTREQHLEWDKALPIIEFGMRNTRSQQTGFSPNEILFGKNLLFNEHISNHKLCQAKDTADYVDSLLKILEVIVDKINTTNYENLEEDDQAAPFEVGDWVWKKIIGAKSGNILYDGPFKIISKIGLNAYRLQTKEGDTLDRNAIHLKLDRRPNVHRIKSINHSDGNTSILSKSTADQAPCSMRCSENSSGAPAAKPLIVRNIPKRKRNPPDRYGFSGRV